MISQFVSAEEMHGDTSTSAMRPLIEEFTKDLGNLQRFYDVRLDPARRERMNAFYHQWQAELAKQPFDSMNQDGKVDYILFRTHLDHAVQQLDFDAIRERETAPFLPFAAEIIQLKDKQRRGEHQDGQTSAAALEALIKSVHSAEAYAKTQVNSQLQGAAKQQQRVIGNRAADNVRSLREVLHTWFAFYDKYDPMFTWWVANTYGQTDKTLQEYGHLLREQLAGIKASGDDGTNTLGRASGRRRREDGESEHPAGAQAAKAGDTSDIIGSPTGRDRLLSDLASEMIPYTPEELIATAYKELAWCEGEMKRASNEMGFGDDWKKALEKVKTMYVEPGKQPQVIDDLEREAEDFVNQHELVTIPVIAHETWRMEMMTPERQLVNPFFTGGEIISVSYPVDSMTFEQKMMSMRGNNIPFSRATVFHELIPGHELQLYNAERFRPYRGELGGTPFTVEGWALYWELRFWDMKFQKTPADRIGALFWRMHRCARIIFSLSFHLGKMTPDECVNFLVDRVGHERENAIGEVRRSFAGDYSPLYQAAYLLGGMQFYALHNDLVGPGKMSERQFHDAILRQNMIPVELQRASLSNVKLTRDYKTNWKFLSEHQIPGLQ